MINKVLNDGIVSVRLRLGSFVGCRHSACVWPFRVRVLSEAAEASCLGGSVAKIWYSNTHSRAASPPASGPCLDWQALEVPDDSRFVQVDLLRNSPEPRLRTRRRLRATRSPAAQPTADGSAAAGVRPGARGRRSACRLACRFLLVRTGDARAERWFAVLGQDVPLLVNGLPVRTGLVALSDRDLLSFAGDSRELAFGTRRDARIERFDGVADTYCPRCKLVLEAGQQVVACPECGAVHHQDEQAELPCWTYAQSCVHCDCPTDLDAPATLWTPDEL